MGTDSDLEPRQKLTLEVGTWVVLSALVFGVQLGRWPAWSALAAVDGYLLWVVLYSEATVQVSRRRAGRLLSGQAAAPPRREHRSPHPRRKD